MFQKVWKRTKQTRAKTVAIVSAVAVAISGFSLSLPTTVVTQTTTAAAASTKTYEGLTDGTILHAFCWSFNTIQANLPDIAAAGYTAVQTSPINAVNSTSPNMKLMGNDPDGFDGAWWWHYQPTDWKIGNYQLGTRDEFKSMCEEADKYGIKIIVDVVPNHTTPALDQVSSDLINAAGGNLYHATGFQDIEDYSNRYDCTRKMMGGLADVDTENTGFQNYFIAFLNDCIACGADGFRYDTAKHIGLPDDPTDSGVNNNFWTRVTTEITNASNIFNYGEVLQGANERIEAYIATIGSTCTSYYGETIRNAVKGMNVTSGNIMGYQVGSAPTKNLVTWVESHDNYINDGTWSQLDDTQIKLAWAIITARQGGIPLFFDRPYGGGPSNMWGTKNTIGIAGSDLYKNDEVVAVNKFRSAMAQGSNGEYLRNPNGDTNVLMIERGTAGVVIVNTKYNSYYINSTTNLADGVYYNHTNDGSKFVVNNGVITGTVPARGTAVLYQAGEIIIPSSSEEESLPSGETIDIYFEKPANWGSSINAYLYGESGSASQNAVWPGQAMTRTVDGLYRIAVDRSYAGGYVVFNDGTNQVPGFMDTGFIVVANGVYDFSGYTGQQITPSTEESSSEEETTPAVIEPVQVTGVKAVYSDGKVTVTWNDNGAQMYKVVRSDGTSGYVNLTYKATAAGWEDSKDLTDAQLYYYRVIGYFKDTDGNLVMGEQSDAVAVVVLDGAPQKVTNLQTTVNNSNVTLTWNQADHVRYYKVSRAAGTAGKYFSMKYNITDASYTETGVAPGLYRYKVVGYYKDVDGSWVYGDLSDTLYVTVK